MEGNRSEEKKVGGGGYLSGQLSSLSRLGAVAEVDIQLPDTTLHAPARVGTKPGNDIEITADNDTSRCVSSRTSLGRRKLEAPIAANARSVVWRDMDSRFRDGSA